jgi:GTPase SAR1 family protein
VIIVEGPDGAGKTTLIGRLCHDLTLVKRGKFVKSNGDGSGTNDLFGDAYVDVVNQPDMGMMVYDRHPMISEYVYGPIVRGRLPEDFTTSQAHATLRLMAQQVLVVWCLPPLSVVHDNVWHQDNEQMRGVQSRIRQIHQMYHSMRMWWPGESVTYDYTSGTHKSGTRYDQVLSTCRLHVATRAAHPKGTNIQ